MKTRRVSERMKSVVKEWKKKVVYEWKGRGWNEKGRDEMKREGMKWKGKGWNEKGSEYYRPIFSPRLL